MAEYLVSFKGEKRGRAIRRKVFAENADAAIEEMQRRMPESVFVDVCRTWADCVPQESKGDYA
jgi:hypothetical protein